MVNILLYLGIYIALEIHYFIFEYLRLDLKVILVPCDSSPYSENALEYAVYLLKQFD